MLKLSTGVCAHITGGIMVKGYRAVYRSSLRSVMVYPVEDSV